MKKEKLTSKETNTEESKSEERVSNLEKKIEIMTFIDGQITNAKKEIRENLCTEVELQKDKLIKGNRNYFFLTLGILALLGFSGWQVFHWMQKKIQETLDNEIGRVTTAISERIDKEFQTERIRSLVEEKAKEYTEEKVEGYIVTKVDSTIEPFTAEIQKNLNKTKISIDELEQMVQIYELTSLAEIGSRNAYEKLLEVGSHKSQFALVANSRVAVIRNSLDLYKNTPGFGRDLIVERNGKKSNVSKMSLREIIEIMELQKLTKEERRMCMVYVKQKPKGEIFKESLDVLKQSESLPTCAAICGVLLSISKRKADFLDFEKWIKICEEELKKEN